MFQFLRCCSYQNLGNFFQFVSNSKTLIWIWLRKFIPKNHHSIQFSKLNFETCNLFSSCYLHLKSKSFISSYWNSELFHFIRTLINSCCYFVMYSVLINLYVKLKWMNYFWSYELSFKTSHYHESNHKQWSENNI